MEFSIVNLLHRNKLFVEQNSHKYISQSNSKVICDDFVTHLICKEYKVHTELFKSIVVTAANQDHLTIKVRRPC